LVNPANVQINPACHLSLLRSNVELKIQPLVYCLSAR